MSTIVAVAMVAATTIVLAGAVGGIGSLELSVAGLATLLVVIAVAFRHRQRAPRRMP